MPGPRDCAGKDWAGGLSGHYWPARQLTRKRFFDLFVKRKRRRPSFYIRRLWILDSYANILMIVSSVRRYCL
jgi:hypothetical protein